MKKIILSICIILFSGFLISCNGLSTNSEEQYESWVPEGEVPETQDTTSQLSDENAVVDEVTAENETAKVTYLSYETEELTTDLINGDIDSFVSKLRSTQKYQQSESTVDTTDDSTTVTLYFSSSEGDNNNMGQSPDSPKKDFAEYSEASNVTILLKAGDTFNLSSAFQVGSNVTIGVYGEGERPVLNYFNPLKVAWTKVSGYTNVWEASLVQVEGLVDGTTNSSNCNSGILRIDGEYNWLRKNKNIGKVFDYPEYLNNTADGSWAIEWENSTIYLYSESDPNKKDIEYAAPSHGLSINSNSNILISGIEVTGASLHGISMYNAQNVTIRDCYIHHIGGGCLNGHSTRYGNAIEIWDSASNVLVEYNVAAWIFDTCYTNQGSTENILQENVTFRRNVGMYSFWGMESWGDGVSISGFTNILYEENILMYACDVTAPEVKIFSDSSGVNRDNNGNTFQDTIPYTTYRSTEYPYHQMSLISASNSSINNALTFNKNVCWGTNRFLCILNKPSDTIAIPNFTNNIFYSEVPNADISLFRVTTANQYKDYYNQLPVETNLTYINNKVNTSEGENQKALAVEALSTLVNAIAKSE